MDALAKIQKMRADLVTAFDAATADNEDARDASSNVRSYGRLIDQQEEAERIHAAQLALIDQIIIAIR